MSRWSLEGYFDDSTAVQKVPIEDFPFCIGRIGTRGLSIKQNDVSRHHAEIVERNNQLYIKDLDSTNGTFVNNHKVDAETHITGNDVLHFAHIESRLIDQGKAFSEHTSETKLMSTGLSNRIPLGANDLKAMIESASIEVVFQSIVDATDQVVGYEVLGRGNYPSLARGPGELFRIAESIGLEIELSELFRSTGLKKFAQTNSDKYITVNMHPNELRDPNRLLAGLEKAVSPYPHMKVILELHEQAVTNLLSLQKLVGKLSKLDISIAYDDFGAGQTRLVELSSVPPEIVKFDIELIRDIDKVTTKRQDMLRTLVAMVHDMGVNALAEGVSREGEAVLVKKLGFDLIQGFRYGQPLTYRELEAVTPNMLGTV